MLLADKRAVGCQTDESLLAEWFKVREEDRPQEEEVSNYGGRSHSKMHIRKTPGLLKYQQLKEQHRQSSMARVTTPSEDVRVTSQVVS